MENISGDLVSFVATDKGGGESIDSVDTIKEEVEVGEEENDPLAINDTVFTCDLCQQVFSEKINLFMHKDMNH